LPLNPVEIVDTVEQRVGGDFPHTTVRRSAPICTTGYYAPSLAWSFQPWSIDVPGYDEAAIALVGNAAIADVKSAVFDLLTFVAELPQTVALVRGRMEDVFDMMDKRAHRVARRASKRATYAQRVASFVQLWLEARYGWRPMMYDIKSITDAYAGKLAKGNLVRGRGRLETVLSDAKTTTVGNGTSEPQHIYADTLQGNRVYRGAAYAEVLHGALTRLQVDPLVTFWETRPLSFVFDWFIDVNSWLQAVSPFSGVNLLGAMVSVRDMYVMEQNLSRDFNYTSSTHNATGGGSCKTILTVNRYHRFPYEIALPGWNPRLTTVKVADLAALIYQRRSKVIRLLTG
jgi:hypothetical protein